MEPTTTPNPQPEKPLLENPVSEKKKKRFHISKKAIFITVGILIVLAVCFFLLRGFLSQKTVEAELNTQAVTKGDITVTISGEGVIEPLSEREIVPQAQGEVLSASFEVGDTVSKDQILFTIDTESVADNVEKSKNALERSQLTYDQSVASLEDLTLTAPFDGTVLNAYVKNGDSVQAGAKIADIVNNSEMKLTVPFLSTDADTLYPGQPVEVTVTGSYYTLSGTIANIPDGSFTSEQNVPVKQVEITVQNPGGIAPGQTATAIAGGVACNDAGTFDYAEQKTVVSKGTGTIVYLGCNTGDVVRAGETILQLQSSSLENSVEQNAYAVRDAQLALDSSQKQLDNYVVRSPITGTVITKDVKAGDVLGTSMTQTVMATIADLSVLTFDVAVDELDISNVQVGQAVQVTADALPDRTFSAHVDSISIKGTSQNGVTTYPVTVKMDDKEGLMPGMNVNAEIIIETKSDVYTVPITAVQRGDQVAVKDDSAKPADGQPSSPQASGEAEVFLLSNGDPLPEGFRLQKVELGVNDADNVEILSGLSEGDIILIPMQKAEEFNPMEMMMGGGAQDSGGPPEGGPGGGGAPNDAGGGNAQ